MTTVDTEVLRPTPPARNVDWPALVASCERKAIPVSRVDAKGDAHLIRTIDDLEEWA